ncbi:MAG: hypothetical protein ACR2FX_05635 [Chthoniobacterales bacterium]
MESFNSRVERSLVKIFLILFGAIVLLAASGYGGMRIFHAWQERRLLAEANALLHEGQFKSASADAQRVLGINDRSAGANRVLAEMGERNGLHAALDLRKRVAELSGNDPADLLAWARGAIRFGDAAEATKALDLMPQAKRETGEYHALQANLALLRHDAAGAEKELSRATELEPANTAYRLMLGTLHLSANDPAAHERGAHELEQLQSEHAVQREVTQRLAQDALRRGEKEQAVRYAKQLNGFAPQDFSARLLLLSALKLAHDAAAEQLLPQLQNEAGDDAEKIGALLGWMNAQKMSRQALAWIEILRPELLTQKTLPLTIADAYLAASDWDGLQKFLRKSAWGPMEYLRSALLARALRELGRTEESAQQWREAMTKVDERSEGIFLLADMAQRWGWEREALDLLWRAAKDPQKADRTLGALYNVYAAKGDTAELYRVLLGLEELRPNDPAVLNNIAQLSLLLKLNTDRGHQLARQVHEEHPANADYTSTYAFSLYLRGENKKAVQAFAGVPEAELHRPSIAAYYGIVLAAAGEQARAREFLELGANANLLPEERALLEKARLTIAQR